MMTVKLQRFVQTVGRNAHRAPRPPKDARSSPGPTDSVEYTDSASDPLTPGTDPSLRQFSYPTCVGNRYLFLLQTARRIHWSGLSNVRVTAMLSLFRRLSPLLLMVVLLVPQEADGQYFGR